jgi:beta-lactam-binding protein with PASTA domain
VKTGRVISQSQRAGIDLADGSSISLVVSRGKR